MSIKFKKYVCPLSSYVGLSVMFSSIYLMLEMISATIFVESYTIRISST